MDMASQNLFVHHTTSNSLQTVIKSYSMQRKNVFSIRTTLKMVVNNLTKDL